MMPTLTKLDLKRAIILEDARRIRCGEKPINNINQLSHILCDKYPELDCDVTYKRLWRLNKYGLGTHGNTANYDKIIEIVCEELSIEREDLLIIVR